MNTVTLVKEVAPDGQILAIFDSDMDAKDFAKMLPMPTLLIIRTVFYEQPPRGGYNA